jgi:ribonuclease D
MGRVVTTAEELAEACVRFADAPYIAIDTEFMRDTTYWPKLCLLQAAIPGFAVAIDPLAPGLDMKPFYDFLARSPSVKVFHAARQDIEIFYHQAGMIPSPLFDTQVAAMSAASGIRPPTRPWFANWPTPRSTSPPASPTGRAAR